LGDNVYEHGLTTLRTRRIRSALRVVFEVFMKYSSWQTFALLSLVITSLSVTAVLVQFSWATRQQFIRGSKHFHMSLTDC